MSSRFGFGKNWSSFIALVSQDRIALAESTLKNMLGVESLSGKSFLDIGSGSGLFSLAARNLGATCHSFDYDADSVAATTALKAHFRPDDADWIIERGDALDAGYMAKLGTFDVVYSWGVLHHTGSMRKGLELASAVPSPEGRLFIAIYNDQGRASKQWLLVKKAYNRLPGPLRWLVVAPSMMRIWGPTMIKDLFKGRPFHTWREYARESKRGMSAWHDALDWIGGLPFEVARPEEIFDFYSERGFELLRLKTCAGGKGRNEYVFKRNSGKKVKRYHAQTEAA
jgi:SAM-dependent methyltransferase